MDAVIYIRYMQRMCKSHISCNGCELKPGNGKSCMEGMDPQKCISVIEQWAAEHPAKTRQSEFLKHYPGARITIDGYLHACPMNVFSDTGINCGAQTCHECRKAFWISEVEDT